MFVGKGEFRQCRVDIPSLPLSAFKILAEPVHRLHAAFRQFVDRGDVSPDEFVLIRARLRDNVIVGSLDSRA